MLVVPDGVPPEISAFAKNTAPGAVPQRLDITPAPNAQIENCGANVEAVVAEYGGKAVKGWRVWWIPGIMIEAQAHVVWRMPNGELHDITPNLDGEEQCVFVPDPGMTQKRGVDFVPSRYQNLTGDSVVDEYIEAVKAVAEYKDLEKRTPSRCPLRTLPTDSAGSWAKSPSSLSDGRMARPRANRESRWITGTSHEARPREHLAARGPSVSGSSEGGPDSAPRIRPQGTRGLF